MSSSDSDDGFYSNVIKNMRIAREQCRKNIGSGSAPDVGTKNSGTSDQGSSGIVENDVNAVKNTETAVNNTTDVSFVNSVEDDFILDEIIAKNSKPTRGKGRGIKRKETTVEAPETCSEAAGSRKRGRGRGSGGKRARTSKNDVTDTDLLLSNALDAVESINSTGRRRSRRNGANNDVNNSLIEDILSNITGNSPSKRPPYSPNSSIEEVLQHIIPGFANGRARGRQRGRGTHRGRGRDRVTQPLMPIASVNITPSYPTYSVGNTDEYPDNSDEVPLFSKPANMDRPKTVTDDVVIVEETDALDDNEPLPVKVIWKSLEVFKFTIRKYQTLAQIFESFAQKENIAKDKLLFTYNNKILSCDDTPASIDYNIAKFIDGGVVSHSVKSLVHNKTKINGIQIKFQCQNSKKPLEITIGKNEKLSLAMTQCAERLELPLNKLKFEFDGDIVTGTSTPQHMGLENGDCIDVMILS